MHAQSHLTLCDPMDCSLLGSSVHGIFQAITLEQVAISFSRVSSQIRDRTHVSCISFTGRRVSLPTHHLGSPSTRLPQSKTQVSLKNFSLTICHLQVIDFNKIKA